MENNATIILKTLDASLNADVELVLYGRAALLLGFPNPPEEFALSQDVDAVMWLGQAEELLKTTNFWRAVDEVNEKLDESGLYITHFFEENQVVLTPDWRKNALNIEGDWKRLRLRRLANVDLLLSKMMRYDPIDIDDALYVLERSRMSRRQFDNAVRSAVVPPIDEIKEQFELCSKKILKLAVERELFS